MKKILGFIVVCFCFSISVAETIYQSQIGNAEENFKKGNFSKTIEIYESLIRIGKVKNPYIYYNLSNAYYKNGNLGKAILNIEKASRLAPRDREIKSNKEYFNTVSGQVQKKIFLDIFLQLFSLNEITTVSAVFLILLLTTLSLFIINRKSILGRIIIVLIIVLIICISLFILKFYNEIILKEAVVLSASNVRNNPDENKLEIFTVPKGKIVSIISESGNWTNIKVKSNDDFLTGWIENNSIGIINE
ncbi:MAG: SH3 domain-containing protein [Endomicrobium sp.]|jgi:tetratricopeptide (TPR) repeat protein|nr:SH3 domain-containing protein [Endomicrobium sp.]